MVAEEQEPQGRPWKSVIGNSGAHPLTIRPEKGASVVLKTGERAMVMVRRGRFIRARKIGRAP